MGITWRSIMPLLSTLAALVIIVHSAEENLERLHRDRRYDLRPRLLDTRPAEHEQPWRVVRAGPMIPQPGSGEDWNNDSQDEPPVRRRLGRKRKRRPQMADDDETPKMTTVPDEDTQETTAKESPKRRRRKNPRPYRGIDQDSFDTESPAVRRGQRRKRPSLDNWPRLSEFGGFQEDEKSIEVDRAPKADLGIYDGDDNEDVIEKRRNRYFSIRLDDDNERKRPVSNYDDEKKLEDKILRPVVNPRYVISEDVESQDVVSTIKEDKSLSEFSMEVMGPLEPVDPDDDDDDDIDEKVREKSTTIFLDMDKAQQQEPIDPTMLKDILKRSNGTSLSEILQQNNLTLADLLNGKENAIAILKSQKILQRKSSIDSVHTANSDKGGETNASDQITVMAPESTQKDIINENTTTDTNQNTDNVNHLDRETKMNKSTTNKDVASNISEPANNDNFATIGTNDKVHDTHGVLKVDQKPVSLENRNSGMMVKRRFPATIRRKLRMRPMVNNTFKSQINRDLIALSARRYVHHRKNATKSKEWRDMIPLMISINGTDRQQEQNEKKIATTTSVPEETTTVDLDDGFETTIINEMSNQNNTTESEAQGLSTDVTETTTIMIEILATEMDASVTQRPILTRPVSNANGLRRQAFNNRLKKKRLKQRTSTTETPQDDIMKNLLEMGDLVSSSEFIARTQLPKVTSTHDRLETGTELEDFLTTETTRKLITVKSTSYPSTKESRGVTKAPLVISTEETSKVEIEEILNDTRTSAKLSRILKERNMTLNELLEHRERGSSHVHLADIFHNASREPNPPEPFLSKSSIEPISKETYPLRAILEANSHEQTTKTTTVDPIYTNHANIPVIMDFGSNVNENAENMGIMSLFNNFTKEAAVPDVQKSTLQQDSKGTPYKSTVIAVNTTDDDDTTRESRMLNDEHDMISWNEIFSMIRQNKKNETNALQELPNEIPPPETYKKIVLEEDVDGDGLIVLEDLQHLKNTDKKVASDSVEKIEFDSYEGTENPVELGILTKAPSSTKSVTVATASIVGLAMILFLLTYAALKWKQQRVVSHKNNFGDERIPTPVFENRKVKKNCSSRSISPMLPTSNIYTMNTLDSQTGKDSPEYMWDTLRKPFQ